MNMYILKSFCPFSFAFHFSSPFAVLHVVPGFFYVQVVVQFYPWFNFYFPLFLTHYNHTLPYTKTKVNKS